MNWTASVNSIGVAIVTVVGMITIIAIVSSVLRSMRGRVEHLRSLTGGELDADACDGEDED